MVEVNLLGIPVVLSQQAREHFDEMLREFVMLSNSDESVRLGAPGRLLELSAELGRRFSALSAANRGAVEEAAERGEAMVDVTMHVTPAATEAAVRLGAALDEVDAFCALGTHLLTLKTPPGPLAYRRWYLAQVAEQVAGAAPVSFADWQAAHTEELRP